MRLWGATVLAVLALCAPAAASETVVKRYGPVHLNGYEVGRGDQVFGIPTPAADGFITKMKARLTYEDGSEVPIANTMLHHVVFANLGPYIGSKQDATCDGFRMFDSQSYLPLRGERFYGLGEERHELTLPEGYGYKIAADDRWAMTFMLMNHLPVGETVFIEYEMEVETAASLKPVVPIWLDVRNCNLDPVYDVPGGGRAGSTDVQTASWTAPTAGRIVASTGHVHGGGHELELSRPDCDEQSPFISKPLWGRRSHPYYSVRPLLHEPGPVSMTTLHTAQGIPVAAGERLQLTSLYDARRPHARVMGILLVALAPDDSVTAKCAPLPTDSTTFWNETEGRTKMPVVRVPITAMRGSRARAIRRPAGPTVRLGRGATVDVDQFRFSPTNLAVPAGTRVRWRFFDEDLHNVTFANGPRAFSSDNLDGGRVFARKLRTPGTYKLFCTLHPVGMASTVRVERRRR